MSKPLPKHLREKRDAKILDKYGDPVNYSVYYYGARSGFDDGYDACYADMLPMVEMLVVALKKYEHLTMLDETGKRSLVAGEALSAWRTAMEEK